MLFFAAAPTAAHEARARKHRAGREKTKALLKNAREDRDRDPAPPKDQFSRQRRSSSPKWIEIPECQAARKGVEEDHVFHIHRRSQVPLVQLLARLPVRGCLPQQARLCPVL